ncbi:MAG: AAA family ATPase [Candidatus Omnitrophica bacterium]|nr:AAA family ATPase [Candidatus Omnitrophota bacterium]
MAPSIFNPKKLPKKIFIAATRQNDGKTTISLGLMAILKERFENIGFIKPIGQRYLVEQGYNIDEDSFLIEEIFGIKCNLKDMSPVAIEKGFTQKYINNPDREPLKKQVMDSFEKVSGGNDLVVIEGTGHAGVGSVFDMSNAQVAKMLGTKVVIISAGGIGRPIDEVMLSVPLFEKAGVEIAGVIINKVQASKYKKINELVRKGFRQHGMNVFGVIPYLKILDMPTMEHMENELDGRRISGSDDNMLKTINNILVATASSSVVMRHLAEKSLIITSGERDDLIRYLLKQCGRRRDKKEMLRGFILTCGFMPNRSTRKLLEKSGIPALVVQEDTYNVVTKLEDMIVKVRPGEQDKIDIITRLIHDHVDVNALLSAM